MHIIDDVILAIISDYYTKYVWYYCKRWKNINMWESGE